MLSKKNCGRVKPHPFNMSLQEGGVNNYPEYKSRLRTEQAQST